MLCGQHTIIYSENAARWMKFNNQVNLFCFKHLQRIFRYKPSVYIPQWMRSARSIDTKEFCSLYIFIYVCVAWITNRAYLDSIDIVEHDEHKMSTWTLYYFYRTKYNNNNAFST